MIRMGSLCLGLKLHGLILHLCTPHYLWEGENSPYKGVVINVCLGCGVVYSIAMLSATVDLTKTGDLKLIETVRCKACYDYKGVNRSLNKH